MSLFTILTLACGGILAENFVFTRYLGLDSLTDGGRTGPETLVLGLIVTCCMGGLAKLTWFLRNFVLAPLNLLHLQTLGYVLLLGALVPLVGFLLCKLLPKHRGLWQRCLPGITTNCAVLGVALLAAKGDMTLLESAFYGLFSGLGFTLALLLLFWTEKRLAEMECPKAWAGFPMQMITAGLICMAFLGFAGLHLG